MDFPEAWQGWYFEDRFLCSPNGDKFQPHHIMAVFYYRQSVNIRLLINNPDIVQLLEKTVKVLQTDLVESPLPALIDIPLPLLLPNQPPNTPADGLPLR